MAFSFTAVHLSARAGAAPTAKRTTAPRTTPVMGLADGMRILLVGIAWLAAGYRARIRSVKQKVATCSRGRAAADPRRLPSLPPGAPPTRRHRNDARDHRDRNPAAEATDERWPPATDEPGRAGHEREEEAPDAKRRHQRRMDTDRQPERAAPEPRDREHAAEQDQSRKLRQRRRIEEPRAEAQRLVDSRPRAGGRVPAAGPDDVDRRVDEGRHRHRRRRPEVARDAAEEHAPEERLLAERDRPPPREA